MKQSGILSLLFLIINLNTLFAQSDKFFFDKSGKASSELQSYYYRTKLDNSGGYKSYYTNGNALYFEGKLTSASETDENLNIYSGKCVWYYKNGKTKAERNFNSSGKENGISRYYYESGKKWRVIEFKDGELLNNSINEYDEDGTLNRIFEDKLDNNHNDWDLYTSDKTSAKIENGKLTLTSYTKKGAARYINCPLNADDFTIEATINISNLNSGDKAGIIFGFKDWQNYNFYLISKSGFYIGFVYEGVSSIKAEGMFSSDIRSNEPNVLKILSLGDNNIYSLNGAVQYKADRTKNFASGLGIAVSGKNTVALESIIFKQIDYTEKHSSGNSPGDENIKSTGSGIIVGANGYVLTSYHVVENASKLLVEVTENNSAKTYKAILVQKDDANDLAILKIDDTDFKPYTELEYSFIDNNIIDVGSSVFTIGFPYALSGMGKGAKFTDGKISSKTGYDGAINSYQTSVPVQPGNSGGPLFNNKGQLIGVVFSKINNADNVSYAVKLNYAKNLIELLPDNYNYPSKSIENLPLEEKVKVLTKYVVLIKSK